MRKFLVCLFLSLATYAQSGSIRTMGGPIVSSPSAAQEKQTDTSNIVVLKEPIDYSFNFEQDTINFEDGSKAEDLTTNHWLALVNFHDEKILNTSNTYTPGTRTLSWAVPYAIASQIYRLEHVHSGLALPMDWSAKTKTKTSLGRLIANTNRTEAKTVAHSIRPRSHVTFIFIPPSHLKFTGGHARAQMTDKTGNPYQDPQHGGGVQLRLNGLPAGTIAVTLPLYKADDTKGRGKKPLKVQELYKQALAQLQTKGYASAETLRSIQEHNHPASRVDDYDGWLMEIRRNHSGT